MSDLYRSIENLSPEKRALLYRRLQERKKGQPGRETIPPHDTSRTSFPLSFGQESFWFLDALHTHAVASNIFDAMRIEGLLDRGKLLQAITILTARHEIFNTTFTVQADHPVQISGSSRTGRTDLTTHTYAFTFLDLSALAESQREKTLQQYLIEEAGQPFDLTHGPLLKIALIYISPGQHVLLIVMPHIIADAWSIDIFKRELALLYNGLFANQEVFLPSLPIQYVDYALWQRDSIQSARGEEDLVYWKGVLTGIPTFLQLPTDHPRPAAQTFQGSSRPFLLPLSLTPKLEALCQSEGVTLFMLLLAAFQVLLSRYTQQENFLLGTPVANRTRSETEGIIGLFMNLLILRANLSEQLTFRELLAHVRQDALDAFAHQETPFEQIVAALNLKRDLSYHPLVQVSFTLENSSSESPRFTELVTSSLDPTETATQFDLTFVVRDSAAGIMLFIDYNTDLFLESTIQRMAGHFQTVLESIVLNPDQSLSDLPFLTQHEQLQLRQWHLSHTDYPVAQCIHRQFEARVEERPDAIAVVFDDQQMTYQQLNLRANHIAYKLKSLGVGADTLVGLCLERSVELVVGMLAILKAGGAYVPLDPRSPMERLEFLIEDAGLQVLLTRSSLAISLLDQRVQLLSLDLQQEQCTTQDMLNPVAAISDQTLAYVIYTSGSTGKPKGVLITHHNITRLFQSSTDLFHFDAQDRWSLFHSPAFDFSVWELWGALLYGGRLVIVPYTISRSPDAFCQLLMQEAITVLNQTPSAFRQLQPLLLASKATEPASFTALRLIIFGGEALDVQSLHPWLNQFGDQLPQLVNMYGITETTVHVTQHRVQQIDLLADTTSPIGIPLADLQVYLLDQQMRLVPIGVPGEIYIGGPGVARGYLRQPKLTAERFVPHPFSVQPGARLYRSGDRARFLPNGDLEYLGRTDQQIKLRGFRIEPGEIEAVLDAHPAVRETAVVVHEESVDDRRLVAYLVPDPQSAFTISRFLALSASGQLAGHLFYELPNGLTIIHQNKAETDFLYREIFTENAYTKYGLEFHEGDCIFDVGANIGLFSLFVHQKCKEATIYAFEPIPQIFESLRLNADLYTLNAKLFNCGLSDQTKEAVFAFYPHCSIISGAFTNTQEDKAVVKQFLLTQNETEQAELSNEEFDELLDARLTREEMVCPLRTISEVLRENQVERIDLLKIDVEKGESDVLSGIQEEDWQKIKQIVIEVHDIDDRLEQITRLLRDHGYALTIYEDALLQGTHLYTLHAKQLLEDHIQQLEPETQRNQREQHWSGLNHMLNDVRTYVKERLPEYLIPAHFVLVEALPLTANGKLDLQVLRQNAHTFVSRVEEIVEPRTVVEQLLAGIWVKILGVDQVSTHDNFFEIGGHSLLATQIISRVRSVLQVNLPLSTLFETPVFADFAQLVEKARLDTSGVRTLLPVAASDKGEPAPLSFAQHRLWFLDQLMPENPFYNLPLLLQIDGPLQYDLLERSLQAIIGRHESLRTHFVAYSEQVIQVADPIFTLPLPLLDLSIYPAHEQERKIQQFARAEAERPFDLAQGLMLRTHLMRLSQQKHILLILVHHISFDGWSVGIFMQELAAHYAMLRDGKTTALPPLLLQYADYARWQRKWLQGDILQAQQAYWQEQLTGAPAMSTFPFDHPRPALQTYQGASFPFMIPYDLTQDLKRLSLEHEVTLYMTLLGAFGILLMRHNGQDDLVVGSPIANRQHEEVEQLIGFFVNTLALRLDLRGTPDFSELVLRVREMLLGAYSHQDLPFERLVEVLQPQRSLSYPPIFQVLFAFQNVPMPPIHSSDLNMHLVEVEWTSAQFDLTMTMEEGEQGLAGVIEYNKDLFEEVTIQRLAKRWQILLRGIVANPHCPIDRLPLLGEQERKQILREWNNTQVAFPEELCIHQGFEEQAARTPDAIAVVYEEQVVSYKTLDQRANQLAHYLQKLGVGPEVRVAICLERSLDVAVALLATLKAGGAYIPLDPSYPAERLAFMLQDAQAPVLLTHRMLLQRLPDTLQCRVVCLDDEWKTISHEKITPTNTALSTDHPAYLIYTSGSTGRPKGALVSHRALVSYTLEMIKQFKLRPIDRFLQFAPISFDVAVEEFFPTWLSGGALILCDETHIAEPARFLDLILRQQLTVFELPTPYWHEWVRELSAAGQQLPAFLYLVIIGGERALPERLIVWKNFHTRLMNVYGITEATVTSTVYELSPDRSEVTPWFDLPIGQPIANTQMYILDPNLEPTPINVPGELYIGGVLLARGYHKRPELTAERFVPHPFSREQGARLYRTGDLGQYRYDGQIEFLGRMDQQVKIRGFRIELGEIEAALSQYPGVQENVVAVRERAPGEKHLVAYCVLDKTCVISRNDLRLFLQKQLPDYMLPSIFVFLETLPLTPTGKLDRRGLPDPEWSTLGDKEHFMAPRTPIEAIVAGLWTVLLGLEQVGANDNFFELGGHSLLIAQLATQMRNVFQIDIPLRLLFEAATVERQAEEVGKIVREKQGFTVPPIVAVARDQKLPLSFAQQRLWFLHQIDPGSTSYTAPEAFRIRGELDTIALESSLVEIVRRHEVLRTTFELLEGQPVQIIKTNILLVLPIVDLSGLSARKREEEAIRLIDGETRRHFDLVTGPLVFMMLIRLSVDEHILALTMHHIVYDGWSMDILRRELNEFYQIFSKNMASQLSDLPIQYADFAYWQRQWLQGNVLQSLVDYWKQHMTNAPVLQLPIDHPNGQGRHGAIQSLQFPASVQAGLKTLSQRDGATLFMTLLAAFMVLLYGYSGQDDIVVGTDVANRNQLEVETLIGFFINQLVLRGDLSGNPTFRQVLSRVREMVLNAYAHQDLPFEKLVEVLHPQRDGDEMPFVRAKFDYQIASAPILDHTDLQITEIDVYSGMTKVDLLMNIEEAPQSQHLLCTLEYNIALFEYATIAQMLECYQTLLAEIVQNPDISLRACADLMNDVRTKRHKEQYKEISARNLQKLKNMKKKPAL